MQFQIDKKQFAINPDLLQANTFTIQSQQKLYDVLFTQAFFNSSVLLVDANVMQHHHALFAHIPPEKILALSSSESIKTLAGVTTVIDFLEKNNITKNETLTIVGGGIIQEIGAFACAIYKRGIPFTLFPSTLLSMCDSCIGGKAGINYHDVKNQLGLFSTPEKIIIDTRFLKSLDQEAIYSGLGEILKSCIIGGNTLLKLYQENVIDGKIIEFARFNILIRAALCVKKAVVEADEFEAHHRRSLNYGHTIGHAIEALANYRISHGQAIVVGMTIENELSHERGLLSAEDLKMLNALCFALLDARIIKIVQSISPDQLLPLIQKDKKTTGNTVCFAFIKNPGEVLLTSMALNQIISSLHKCLMWKQ